MKQKKGIVIAEDHTILREGLKVLLSSNPNFEIIGEAKDGYEALQRVSDLNPDLILIDLSMPRMNGIETIKEIKKMSNTKILVLTVHRAEEYVLAALEAGADGYILKDATREELLLAINSVLAGRPYLSPSISGKVIEGYLKGKKIEKPYSRLDLLTLRERQVLKLIAEGHKNKEIAECLCISVKTVEKHRSNLMKKLDLHSATALTSYAIEKGLVSEQ
ncbi:MAG TPA: response regulator transcription factor [Deltaproteobacteria bacterium]|nr:MAG: DNA-binding response regulator [Deltaproteobacteria bacterium]HDM77872.1 response regulator transcription factor [Deltaproteobacteria bacterium]